MSRKRKHEVSVHLTLEELAVILAPIAERAEQLQRLGDSRLKAAESAFSKINDSYRAGLREMAVAR